MFTGIIGDVGVLTYLEAQGDLKVRIATGYVPEGIDLGASIACNGVCLTVVAKGRDENARSGANTLPKHWFEVEISAESVARTNINLWREGTRLNLERALRLGDELGGHIVLGHVDGVAKVVQISEEGDSTRIRFDAPKDLSRFIAPKGSVALNGTSLTINEVEGTVFGVNLISHTKAQTNWDDVAPGDLVNLEIDPLARYVARLHDTQDV